MVSTYQFFSKINLNTFFVRTRFLKHQNQKKTKKLVGLKIRHCPLFVRPFYQLTAVDECRYTSIGMLILMDKNTTESMRASSVKCVDAFARRRLWLLLIWKDARLVCSVRVFCCCCAYNSHGIDSLMIAAYFFFELVSGGWIFSR